MNRRTLCFACLATMLTFGCDPDDAGAGQVTLSLDLENLPPLESTSRYEAWLVHDDEYESIGKFDMLADGVPDPVGLTASSSLLAAAQQIVISIEPDDGDPTPAQSKVLAGDLDAVGAELTVAHPKALGDDFTSAAGKFMLATPTTGGDDQSEQGIWWIDPDSGDDFLPGLSLPALPAGWKYEGWVEDDTGTESTGKFVRVDDADEDGAGATASLAAPPPPFPGRDFIDPPRDLTANHKALISIEPDPDPSGGQFTMKALMKDIEPHVFPATQDAVNIAAEAMPKGSIVIMGNP
jgi:hypothetical protein